MTKWKKTAPPDPLLNHITTAQEAGWRTAMQPVDRRVSEIEKQWGCVERLQECAGPELAGRFGSAWHKLNAAIIDGELDEVVERAGVVLRGLDALERAAKADGHNPFPETWGIAVDGVEYLVCLRARDVRAVSPEVEGIQVWSLEELIRVAVSSQAGAYAQIAKGLFPEAVVKDVREGALRRGPVGSDAIPF
jgi:hypothetical protein